MTYYSNCLFEAIKAKVKCKNIKLIYISPFKNEIFCPHFMWHNCKDNTISDFHTDKSLKGLNILWFKGYIRTRPYTVYERWVKTSKWESEVSK